MPDASTPPTAQDRRTAEMQIGPDTAEVQLDEQQSASILARARSARRR